MTLDVLQKEMISAMKAKDKIRKDTVSSIIGNIKTAAINENCRNDIPESLVDRVLLKEKKTMQEMIDTCTADRTETLAEYNQKMAIINEFVPKMMSEKEIKDFVKNEIVAMSINNPRPFNKGDLMKRLSPKLKGKADMKLVNKIVTKIVTEIC